ADHAAIERVAYVDRVAAPHRRVPQRERLRRREAAEEHRHAEGRELVVRHVAAGVSKHELRELLPAELLSVALPLDQLRRADQGVRIGWPGIPRDGALPFSHAFTVAPTSANSPSCTCPSAFFPAT